MSGLTPKKISNMRYQIDADSSKGMKVPVTIYADEKIHGPDDMQRKHSIRELAMDYGIPEVAAKKQKKALQYGSQIHKSLLKSRKTS